MPSLKNLEDKHKLLIVIKEKYKTMTIENLRNARIIGKKNFDEWSQGQNEEGYLKVLPNPDRKIAFKDPYQDWQNNRPGNYFSSWGPDEELDLTLTLENLEQIEIEGLGILKSGDGEISWLDDRETPYESLRGYNQTIPGPMLITEPGDTIDIELVNNLEDAEQSTNLHTHGLHVSALGYGDNVLTSIAPGETWPIEIKIPDDHFIGPMWYHPHLHGDVNVQVASGLAGMLIFNPPHDLPDLDKWNPKEESMHFLAINSFGIQQVDREGKPDDPLNQNSEQSVPAGTPLEVLGETENGEKIYELSDAVYIGFNGKPESHDPQNPTEYGSGVLSEPVENVIHTVNGQYNPTLELETGAWNTFSFANTSTNSFHVVQLVKQEGDRLIPQEVNLVAIDGDSSGVVEDIRREITELPILNPGSRVSIQNWFEEPGTYYILSNGTEEILGDDAPTLTKDTKGFFDGHLTWGPQVLASIEVKGEEIPAEPFPEPYNTLTEQSQNIDELVQAAQQGDFDRERTFVWSANVGGAIAEGNTPDDTEVLSFEGAYRINGEYYSTEPGGGMPPLSMPMLGTTEVWNIVNESGISDESLAMDMPLAEWHPFHIHQNDFVVLEINGIPVEDIEQNYLDGVLSDTIALAPAYQPGTVTPENPYGIAQVGGTPSEVRIMMNFEDYPGSYVNHCHILFHEDAGMMAVVRVILNTEDTWLGLGNPEGDPNGTEIELIKANSFDERISLKPYGEQFTGGVDLAIADVNYKTELDNNNVTDNVTDVVSLQSSLDDSQNNFTVKVFDGQTLIDRQEQGIQELNGQTEELLITEFTPFADLDIDVSSEQIGSVAAGDINGDGYGDIIVGIGGGIHPLIEVYSGADYQLLSRINPFHNTEFDGKLNLAVGDVDGDNFSDIIVGQGAGGSGLVEAYSGQLIDAEGKLDGYKTAEQTSIFQDAFQPYGDSYHGEVEVTSGYSLQRPQEPNEKPSQTNNANITTLAVDNLADKQEKIKVFSFLGGHHGSHGSSESSDTDESMEMEHQGDHNISSDTDESMETEHQSDHNMSSDSTEMETENSRGNFNPEEIRLETEFTPDSDFDDLSGTFADIPGRERGEPILFGRTQYGNPEIIHLAEENIPENFNLTLTPTEISGTSETDVYAVANQNDSFDGNSDTIYANSGDDYIDASGAIIGQNHIHGGKGNDELIAGKEDRLYGGEGQDILDASLGHGGNRLNGDRDNDLFFLGRDDIVVGGSGDDLLFVGSSGNNQITGGEGRDRFWIVNAQLPDSANIITDLNLNEDVIGIAGYGEEPNLVFGEDNEGNATLALNDRQIATFLDITQDRLETATFSFV